MGIKFIESIIFIPISLITNKLIFDYEIHYKKTVVTLHIMCYCDEIFVDCID
jgi:hypothetical protein